MSQKRQTKETFPPSEISWAAISFERESDPFVYRFVIYFLTILIGTVMVFSNVAKVPITVLGEGKITSLQPPVPIRSSAKMTVDVLNVVENQHVKKGQVILKSKEDLSREDMALMNRILQEYNNVLKNELIKCKTCISQLRIASTRYMALKTEGELMNVVTPLADASRELILALEEYTQIPYRVQDARLQININKKKLIEIRNKKAEGMLAKEVENLTTEIATNQSRINEKLEHARERISAAQIQLTARMADLRNRTNYLGHQYAVFAPFDGIIVSLNVKGSGELLQVGQELFSLVPENSPLIVELKIENKDLSDISKKATASINLDSLPEFDYGYATGHVIDITRKQVDSNAVTQNERSLASDAPVFIARIALDQQALYKNGVASPFMIGMTAKGQINVRSESLLHTAIRALFQTRYELQGSGK